MPPAERMTEREIIERGEQARAVLDGPLFTEVIAKHRQELLEMIAASKPDEREVRENCYFQIQSLAGLRNELRRIQTRGDKKRDKVTN
ncbi:MAG: hypothetical protein OEU92_27455 [Alphaproteobacteria bacterium]|nr:hypothetical protein [Alphaproteobacteria bacterium]